MEPQNTIYPNLHNNGNIYNGSFNFPSQNNGVQQQAPAPAPAPAAHFLKMESIEPALKSIKDSAISLKEDFQPQKKSASKGGKSSKSNTYNFIASPFSFMTFGGSRREVHHHHYGPHSHHQGEKKDEGASPLVRILVGVAATAAAFFLAYSLGNDYARLKECSSLKSEAKKLLKATDGKVQDDNVSSVKLIANNAIDLAKKVRNQTIKNSILPKAVMVAGVVAALVGAIFNFPIAIGVGLGVSIIALAAKIFLHQANKKEDVRIGNEAEFLENQLSQVYMEPVTN